MTRRPEPQIAGIDRYKVMAVAGVALILIPMVVGIFLGGAVVVLVMMICLGGILFLVSIWEASDQNDI